MTAPGRNLLRTTHKPSRSRTWPTFDSMSGPNWIPGRSSSPRWIEGSGVERSNVGAACSVVVMAASRELASRMHEDLAVGAGAHQLREPRRQLVEPDMAGHQRTRVQAS